MSEGRELKLRNIKPDCASQAPLLVFRNLGGCMNYIFPLLAGATTIGLFVLYAMVRQSMRRSPSADELPRCSTD